MTTHRVRRALSPNALDCLGGLSCSEPLGTVRHRQLRARTSAQTLAATNHGLAQTPGARLAQGPTAGELMLGARYCPPMPSSAPWCIGHVALENFRSFELLEVDLERDVTVLVGRNGFGKTALLDAIAVLLSPMVTGLGGDSRTLTGSDARATPESLASRDAVAHMTEHWPVRLFANGLVGGREHHWDAHRLKNRGGRTSFSGPGLKHDVSEVFEHEMRANFGVLPLIAAYGVDRGSLRLKKALPRWASRSLAYAGALDAGVDIRVAGHYFSELQTQAATASALGDVPPYAAIEQIRSFEIAIDIVLGETAWRLPRWNPRIREITLEHPDYGTLPVSYLSAGIRTTVALVMDLVARAARANPKLGDHALLESVPGIVLIDEVDLHLHPEWQKTIVSRLTACFPSVQFLVTTHSPQVLSHTEARQVRDLEDPARTILYSRGLKPEVALREVLRTDPEPRGPEREQLHEYLHMVFEGRGESSAAKALRVWIERHLGGPENVPELAQADAHIAFEHLVD